MTDALREAITQGVQLLDAPVLWYFAVLNVVAGVLFLVAAVEVWKDWTRVSRLYLSDRFPSRGLPPVSVILPVRNEAETIVETVAAQLDLRYSNFELIVVNDGSEDRTFQRLREEYDLYEVPPAFPRKVETETIRGYYRSMSAGRLLVVDKETGGRRDSLNAGLSAASYPLVAAVDGDTIVDRDALPRLVRPFLAREEVAGAAGTVRMANGCRFRSSVAVDPRSPESPLAGLQLPDHLRTRLFERLGWNPLGGALVLDGALALFRKDLLLRIGGYPVEPSSGDPDLALAVQRELRESDGSPHRFAFIPDVVAWSQVPEELDQARHQREAQQQHLVRGLWQNREMFLNPRYRRQGLLGVPLLAARAVAPAVEAVGYAILLLGAVLGVLNLGYAALFLFLVLAFPLLLSLWSALLEQVTYGTYPRQSDLVRVLGYVLLEPFGYRQLDLWWRLKGMARSVLGRSPRESERENRRMKLVRDRLTAAYDELDTGARG